MITESEYLIALKIVRKYNQQITEEIAEAVKIGSTKLDDLRDIEIPMRIQYTLRNNIAVKLKKRFGDVTLGDICQFHKNELRTIRNFGGKSLMELEYILESRGLKLNNKHSGISFT